MEKKVHIPFNWNNMRASDNLENDRLLLPSLEKVDEHNVHESIDNYQQCRCCPYGYHIDIDFVQYCEALVSGLYLKQLKQLRKSRRKQRKSIEALLHYHEKKDKPIDTARIKSDCQNQTLPEVRPDELKEAIFDFEKTLENSFSSSLLNNQMLMNDYYPQQVIYPKSNLAMVSSFASSKSKSGSTSSINSVSTVSSLVDNIPRLSSHLIASQQIATTMAALSNSLISPQTESSPIQDFESANVEEVKMKKSALHSIRQQMANSLTRMRELEEHVKNIPILQVKLSVLKEEKRLLMLQLKAKNYKLDQNSIGVDAEAINNMSLEEMSQRLDRLGAIGITSPSRSRKMTNGNQIRTRSVSPPASHNKIKLLHPVDFYSLNRIVNERKAKRNIGVGCHVMTRDVGVSHIQPATKSISVSTEDQGDSFCFICKSEKSNKCQLKYTCSDCLQEKKICTTCPQCEIRKLKIRKDMGINTDNTESKVDTNLKKISIAVNTSPINKVSCGCNAVTSMRTSFTSTELSMKEIVSKKEVDALLLKEKNKNVKTFADIAIQHFGIATKNTFTQTVQTEDVQKKEIGVNVLLKPQTFDKSIGSNTPFDTKKICSKCSNAGKQRSIAIGDATINDNFCERCDNLKTKTIGIGTGNVKLITCDMCERAISEETKVKASSVRKASKYTDWKQSIQSPHGFLNKGFETSTPTKEEVLNTDHAHNDSSESTDSDSSDSPDEGSYDGIYGNIVHTCHDDEAIRQGLPGASMFQPIQEKMRIKHKLSTEMTEACVVLDHSLTNQNQVPSKKLNASLNLIQQEWFRVSSQKNSEPNIIEDYLDAFEDISQKLLNKIVNLTDANDNTTMHYAVSHGNFDIVGILLDSKVVDITKQNKAGYTCTMLASLAPIKYDVDRHILQRLFQIGDINLKAAQHGQTALMLAVSHGRLDVVKMLVEAGADINIQDEDGSTALMCASEHGHIEIVRYILSLPDCDPTITDNDNSTALTIAMEADHRDIGVLLYAHMNITKDISQQGSFKIKRSRSSSHSITPPPSSPALSRHSTTSMP